MIGKVRDWAMVPPVRRIPLVRQDNTHRRPFWATPLVSTMVMLVGCTSPSTNREGGGADAPIIPQRTLSIAVRGEPPSLAARPLITFSGALGEATQAFNGTFDYIDERGLPRPVLAEALPEFGTDTWRTFPDGRMETTYRLRPSLTWHDGNTLTAEDFVFAWRVYSTPELGNATSRPVGQMAEVMAPDPKTVVIRWRVPYPDAASLAGGFQALPRHILEAPFRDLDPIAFTGLPFWTSEYIGLGAYRIDTWEAGAFILGQAFDGYALGRPKIDRVKFVFIPDPQTALANALAGEVHYVANLIFTSTEGETLEQQWAQSKAGIVLYSATGFRSTNIQLRREVADPSELLDIRFRRALAHAIDRVTAAEILGSGHAIATQTITSPQVEYYPEIDRVIQKYPYDPRQAQQIVEQIGFVRGGDGLYVHTDGRPLKVPMAASAGSKNEQELATYADFLRRAGFDAQQNVIPSAQIGDPQLRALLPGAVLRGGGPGLEGLTTAEIARAENRWNGGNRYGWSSPGYDRAFEAWTSTLSPSARIQHLAEMERIMTEELPIIPNYFEASVNAHAANLEGPLPRQTESGPPLARLYLWAWRF